MELQDKVVVVTGASAGIGEATAVALARRGARVVMAARRLDRLEALADRIDRAGGRAFPLTLDVRDQDAIEALPAQVERLAGASCDILVNNAGVPGGGDITELSPERIREIVEVNLLSVVYGCRAFLPGMRERRRGHIVNMASLAGRYAAPGAGLYTATKHAVVGLTESLHQSELVAGSGVRVTAVDPWFVTTEGFPQEGIPRWLVLRPEHIGEAVVRVVQRGIAPEYSVPRWVGPFQLFRILTPPLYRWGLRSAGRVGMSATRAKEDDE